jgi:hypothetical protein
MAEISRTQWLKTTISLRLRENNGTKRPDFKHEDSWQFYRKMIYKTENRL